MKKLLVILSMFFLLCGCGNKESGVLKKWVNKINKLEGYSIKGTLTISSNEDTFIYSVESNKNKDGFYKVSLVNQNNNHEQIILKNNEGVFVVTPELNKSFKFQSDWPNNGSQSYLLDMLVKDVENDDNVHVSSGSDKYIQTRVNYPNNSTLYSEKIYLKDNLDLDKVEVLDQDGNIKISFKVNSIKYNPNLDNELFSLDSFISEDEEAEEENSSVFKDIIYPLYLPVNTHLNTEDTISTDNGNRAILTFSGDSPFVLVEESSRKYDEFEIIPVNGEPIMMSDTIGALSNKSLYWSSNGIDYYLSSNQITGEDLMTIAEGLTGTSIIVSSEK